MGGTCCGCDVWADEKKKYSYSPLSADKKKTENPFNKTVGEEAKEVNNNIEDSEDWKEYKALMQLVFYTFAGYQPWAKITSLYMHQKELQRFLEIVNIDDCLQQSQPLSYQFTIQYRFNFTKNIPKDYANNVWFQRRFSIKSVASTNRFYLKIPSCLFNYELEYNLTMFTIKYDQKFENIQVIDTISSSNYTANVPSILIETTFKIDEYVQYRVENTGYVRSGTIIEILDEI